MTSFHLWKDTGGQTGLRKQNPTVFFLQKFISLANIPTDLVWKIHSKQIETESKQEYLYSYLMEQTSSQNFSEVTKKGNNPSRVHNKYKLMCTEYWKTDGLIKWKGHISLIPVIVNDLRTSLWLTDSSSRQKYQQRHQLNYSKEQMDLTNIYRLCHSTDL